MKTLVNIDDEALAAAMAALGTRTKVDTVNRALMEVAALAARRRDIERWTSGEFPDASDDGVDAAAWR